MRESRVRRSIRYDASAHHQALLHLQKALQGPRFSLSSSNVLGNIKESQEPGHHLSPHFSCKGIKLYTLRQGNRVKLQERKVFLGETTIIWLAASKQWVERADREKEVRDCLHRYNCMFFRHEAGRTCNSVSFFQDFPLAVFLHWLSSPRFPYSYHKVPDAYGRRKSTSIRFVNRPISPPRSFC